MSEQATTERPQVPQEKIMASAAKILTTDPRFKVGAADISGNSYRIFENAPPSLVGIFMFGASHGDKDFILSESGNLSHAETFKRACRFAHGLQEKYGVKKGDRVAIAMRNYPEWCVAYMGIVMLGGVVVPLNAWWKTDEFDYALGDCEAKLVLVDAKRLAEISPLREKHGLTLILAHEEADGADDRYEAILEASQNETVPSVEIAPEDDFCISYTSGSTGQPKGVILTHRGAVSVLFSWAFVGAVLTDARDGKSIFGGDPGILLGIPLFHVTGSHSNFMLSYMVGRRMAMIYRWDPIKACEIIRDHKLTNFVGVPSQSYELIDAAGPEGLPSLIDIGSGGAKRPPEHVRALKEKFPHANPSSGYGMTETNALGCIISLDDAVSRPDSTGRAVPPLTDIKIVRDDETTADVGEVGEIWIRSPGNFRGYLNKPEETAKTLTSDGWVRTGDLGKLDAEGFLYIVDRLKDLIIRGGENISCLEVEARAYEHASVAEAVVFAVPDDALGERVGLVVFAKDGDAIDAKALRDFMADDFAGFKVPEHIWVSPQALPRLGSAKFDKQMIKAVAMRNPATWAFNK
ncbi:MAG: class I adenylate-forming enzyme family protein [Pseudomonadota bacterium]